MEDPHYRKVFFFLNLSLFSKSTVICFNSSSNVNHSPVASLWTSLMWSHVKSSITPESSERDYLYSCRLLFSPSTKIKRRSSTVWFWSLSSEEKFFAGGQRAARPDLVSQNSPPRDIHICLLKKKKPPTPSSYSFFFFKISVETLLSEKGENPVTRDYYQLARLFLNGRNVSEDFSQLRRCVEKASFRSRAREKRRTTNISFIAQKWKNLSDVLFILICYCTLFFRSRSISK